MLLTCLVRDLQVELNQARNKPVPQKCSGRRLALHFRHFIFTIFHHPDALSFWCCQTVFFPMLWPVSAWLLQVDRPSTTLGVAEAFQAISAPFMTSWVVYMTHFESRISVSLWRTVIPCFHLDYRVPYRTKKNPRKAWHLWFDPKELSSPQIVPQIHQMVTQIYWHLNKTQLFRGNSWAR